jgi:hypothetical protein
MKYSFSSNDIQISVFRLIKRKKNLMNLLRLLYDKTRYSKLCISSKLSKSVTINNNCLETRSLIKCASS